MAKTAHLAFIYALASLIIVTRNVSTHIGSSAQQVYIANYVFQATGGATACKIQLSITKKNPSDPNTFSALMYANVGNSNTLSTSLLYYFHKNPINYNVVDLQNANTGQSQVIKLGSLVATNNIYIQLLVDSTVSFDYTITATEMLAWTSSCLYPAKTQSYPYAHCSDCASTFYTGAYCNYLDISLSNNTQTTKLIASGKYVAFTIPGTTSQINLNYMVDVPYAQVFIQFKTFSGEVAGLINKAQASSGYADYIAYSPYSTYQTTINSGGSDISVGVINQGTSNLNFTIWYTTQKTLNILIIILGVLGGVLLIVLIIAACCIIKRMRNPSQMIHPNASMVANQIQIQQNMLSPQEIQMYFPSVSCRIVFTDLQSSSINLNSKQDLNIDKDCVICLCPVDVNELMKVTYCRHIFHSHCLVEWFKKQRNCPYCREEYSKSSTIQHYQNLLKNTHKNMLAGGQLAKAIFMSKMNKSAIMIEQMKD